MKVWDPNAPMTSSFSPTCIFSTGSPNHFGCPHLAALKTPLPTPGMDAPAGHFPPPFGNVLQSFQIAFRYHLVYKENLRNLNHGNGAQSKV